MTEIGILMLRHEFFRYIREFFYDHGYLEVETPNIMKVSPPDPNIDPLRVYVGEKGPFYLHTSPEMHMKKLLQYGHNRIFQICKVYRVEEFEDIHNTEFTMLEWYREGTYLEAMEEVEELVSFVSNKLDLPGKDRFKTPYHVYELDRLCIEKTGIDPFPLSRDGLFAVMHEAGLYSIDEKDDWNDLFFKLLVQEVEDKIDNEKPYFIKDWPQSISTMAKKKGMNKVERFELYIDGVEITNGYTELLDKAEQRARFVRDNAERSKGGKEVFGIDEDFLDALSGLQGSYTGVSLGVDRLLMTMMDKKRIDEVMVQRLKV
ncbi:MAG: EF-P lysine aminoacylase GenX [Syntrophus sp. (in: bacteria)]|nr:EF-P lysine aminoacylase GenX [Syntrophus sp. (in: bacteria)]